MTSAPELDTRRLAALKSHYPDEDLQAIDVTIAVGRAAVAIERRLAERIKEYELTPVALQALISVLVADGGPVNLKTLGDELRVTKANVSWVLGRLDEQRLITREVEPTDGRRIRVRLTRRGRSIVDELVPIARDAMEEALSDVSAKDRQQLRRIARQIG